jgi:peptidoglycan/LPS O-acetylase OafA/YrhL
LYSRRLYLLLFLLGSAVSFGFLMTVWTWGDAGVVFVRPHLLIYSFFIGVLCYVYADKIVIKKTLFLLCIAGLYFFNLKYTTILGVVCACYLCLCIAFMDLRKFPLIKYGDFSYGIYLYGFPIQQTIWHFFPFAREWWGLFLVAFPVSIFFSVISWRLIEQPFLSLKHHFKRSF